eukprot:scaffold119212_cov54-Phaeocystis_antarctica.AAC.1
MVANVREAYSAVRLLCGQHDLVRAYNLRRAEISEVGEECGLSPHGFCCTLPTSDPNPLEPTPATRHTAVLGFAPGHVP